MIGTQCEALVLRVLEFGESDRIVHLLTPTWGRVTAIAKGAKRSQKRFFGTLDLFHRLHVEIVRHKPHTMARLENTRLLEGATALRRDAKRFCLASYLVELIDRLATEGGTDSGAPDVYAVAREVLGAVSTRPPDFQSQAFLELRLLAALGFKPELSHCVRCGTPLGTAERVIFHVGEGGPLCPACLSGASGLRVRLATLRALELSLRLPADAHGRLQLRPELVAEARALVRRFQRFHVGVELRSEPVLDQMLGRAAALPVA